MKVSSKARFFGPACLSLGAMFALCACSGSVSLEWQLDDLGDSIVGIHTDLQTQFLSSKNLKLPTDVKGKEELSRPAPVHIEWSAESDGKEVTIQKYLLELSLDSRFNESVVYETVEPEFDVYNLLLDATYYYRVTAVTNKGKKSVSPLRVLETTDAAPRNLYVDGVTNVRDLGGWKTADGGRVKQGMLIRCGRLNKSKQSEVEIEITERGIHTFKDILGVRSEIDLRLAGAPKQAPETKNENGGITSSPLGSGVKYKNLEMEWIGSAYKNYFEEAFQPVIREFFAFIADESNYPVIFHCDIGTDRTGFFAFLVNGLLGVSEEDLSRDYLFSNFANIGDYRDITRINSTYLNHIKAQDGDTLSEKIENSLLEIGVERSHIDAVRRIMTEY